MTVILRALKPGGGVRRCDAACHLSEGKTCRCICGGRYHGQGKAALSQFQADVAAGDWAEFLPEDGFQLRLPIEGEGARVRSIA